MTQNVSNNNDLPGKKNLGVFALLSVVWFGLSHTFPNMGGLMGYMDNLIAIALISIWTGVFYYFIAKDIDRREKLEQLAQDLQHREVRILLNDFGPLKALLDDREFRTFKNSGPNVTLTLFIALAAVVILYLVK